MRFVSVVWHDAHADTAGTWTTVAELTTEPYVVTTVGVLVRPSKQGHISIAQSVADDGHIDSVLHIPTTMVVSFHELRQFKEL